MPSSQRIRRSPIHSRRRRHCSRTLLYNWKVVSRTYASDAVPSADMASDIWSFTTGAATAGDPGGGGGTSGPFSGTALALPGTIQAENFDNGGKNVAYLDSDYRQRRRPIPDRCMHVDIEATNDGGPGWNVGWVGAGEWLEYTVNVGTAGNYNLEFRVASAGAGGTFHLEVNNVDKTGPLTVPSTGDWQSWTTVTKDRSQPRGRPTGLEAGVRQRKLQRRDRQRQLHSRRGRNHWRRRHPAASDQYAVPQHAHEPARHAAG